MMVFDKNNFYEIDGEYLSIIYDIVKECDEEIKPNGRMVFLLGRQYQKAKYSKANKPSDKDSEIKNIIDDMYNFQIEFKDEGNKIFFEKQINKILDIVR